MYMLCVVRQSGHYQPGAKLNFWPGWIQLGQAATWYISTAKSHIENKIPFDQSRYRNSEKICLRNFYELWILLGAFARAFRFLRKVREAKATFKIWTAHSWPYINLRFLCIHSEKVYSTYVFMYFNQEFGLILIVFIMVSISFSVA